MKIIILTLLIVLNSENEICKKIKNKAQKNRVIFYISFKIIIIFTSLFIIILNLFQTNIKKNIKKNKFFESYETQQKNGQTMCNNLDPINMFNIRIKNGPITICQNRKSKHICYQNGNEYDNDILWYNNGVICTMENIILNPSKSMKSKYIYKGPVDSQNQGSPILLEGFFNMNCKDKKDLYANTIYNTYFNSWNYHYKKKKGEKIEELAPNKTILFLSRNQDSPNLFHGNSEIINVLSMMYLFNLNPENIQVIFLESMDLKDDPLYVIYKNVISSQSSRKIHKR